MDPLINSIRRLVLTEHVPYLNLFRFRDKAATADWVFKIRLEIKMKWWFLLGPIKPCQDAQGQQSLPVTVEQKSGRHFLQCSAYTEIYLNTEQQWRRRKKTSNWWHFHFQSGAKPKLLLIIVFLSIFGKNLLLTKWWFEWRSLDASDIFVKPSKSFIFLWSTKYLILFGL